MRVGSYNWFLRVPQEYHPNNMHCNVKILMKSIVQCSKSLKACKILPQSFWLLISTQQIAQHKKWKVEQAPSMYQVSWVPESQIETPITLALHEDWSEHHSCEYVCFLCPVVLQFVDHDRGDIIASYRWLYCSWIAPGAKYCMKYDYGCTISPFSICIYRTGTTNNCCTIVYSVISISWIEISDKVIGDM